MRRVIVQEFVTIDGLAAGPNGEVDFIPASTEGDSGAAEYQLWLLPVVLGGGRPLFARGESIAMELLEAETTDKGATLLRYRPL